MSFTPLYPEGTGFTPIGTGDASKRGAGSLAYSNSKRQKLEAEALESARKAQEAESFGGMFGETIKGTAASLIDPTLKFAGSAIKAPVDIASQLTGGKTDVEARIPGIGGMQKSIQGEFASETLPAVERGEKSPLMGTVETVGQTILGAGETLGMKGFVSGLQRATPKAVSTFRQIAESLGERFKPTAQKELEYALDLTMPRTTRKVSEEAIAQGRITTPGVLRPTKITPNPRDNLVAESVQDVVSPKNSLTQNIEAINQKVSQVNAGVREMLATRKVPFNRNQLKSRLNANKEESKLVFASDATAERTYNAVVDEFLKHVDKKDTLGLFEARQSFDKIPAIKKLLDSEGLGENVRRQIVLDVRRAANEYVADLLDSQQVASVMKYLQPKETRRLVENAKKYKKPEDFVKAETAALDELKKSDLYRAARRRIDKAVKKGDKTTQEGLVDEGYENSTAQDLEDIWHMANSKIEPTAGKATRAALRSESRMIEAIGNMAEKNASTIGKNQIQILTDKYPILKWVVGGAAGAAGVGVGGTIIESLD